MEVMWVAHVDGGLRVEAVQIGAIEQARRDAGRLLRAAKQQGHVPCVAHPDALRCSARLHKKRKLKPGLRNRSKHAQYTILRPKTRPRCWQTAGRGSELTDARSEASARCFSGENSLPRSEVVLSIVRCPRSVTCGSLAVFGMSKWPESAGTWLT